VVKLVTAVIRAHRLDEVRAVAAAAGARGMTVSAGRGFGRQRGRPSMYRGAEYKADLVPNVRVEVLADIFDAEQVASAIAAAARTGQAGDGKVWISDVERLVRIRTGEVGVDAV
jgi:nitrogen regulatory protein P-II 1